MIEDGIKAYVQFSFQSLTVYNKTIDLGIKIMLRSVLKLGSYFKKPEPLSGQILIFGK